MCACAGRKVDGCGQFDKIDQNNSYAIVGQHLLEAVKKRGTGPIVYHPSNLVRAKFRLTSTYLGLSGLIWR